MLIVSLCPICTGSIFYILLFVGGAHAANCEADDAQKNKNEQSWLRAS